MIFIGNGSLLERAIDYVLNAGYTIDKVYTKDIKIIDFCNKINIENEFCININKKGKELEVLTSDRVVFSINNEQILSAELINLEGFKFYNVHNGIVPTYRGQPSVCVIYAILNNETEYGVSLHEIDIGIDTGKCIDIIKFKLSQEDTFESIMMKSIELCSEIIKKNMIDILQGNINYLPVDISKSRLYKFNDLNDIWTLRNSSSFKRATDLGVFKYWLTDLNDFMKQNEIIN